MQFFVKYTQWNCFCSNHCKIFLYYLIGKKIRGETIFLIFRILVQFVESSDSPRISNIRRMLLSIIYSASYCFTVFDYKLQSDQFSSRLLPRQVSVKIPVILRMSIKFANIVETEHEFLCFIDKNKKNIRY